MVAMEICILGFEHIVSIVSEIDVAKIDEIVVADLKLSMVLLILMLVLLQIIIAIQVN